MEPTHEEIAVSTTAVGLTTATIAGQNHGLLTVAGAAIRWRIDGGTATTDSGHVAAAGSAIVLEGSRELQNFSAIRDDATDAELTCTYSQLSALARG